MASEKDFEKIMDKLCVLVQKETRLINFDAITNIIVSAVLDLKGKEMYGIFYKFGTILTTSEGDVNTDELVVSLAENIAKKGFVVLAGNYIYEEVNGKIGKEKTTIHLIKNTIETYSDKYSEIDSLKRISQCLANIMPYAVFILLNEASTSEQESYSFYNSRTHKPENKKSIAILFTDILPTPNCKFLTNKKSKEGLRYLVCDSNDFKNICSTEEKNCFFTQETRINASQIQVHINAPYSKLVVTDTYNQIHNLILGLMECR